VTAKLGGDIVQIARELISDRDSNYLNRGKPWREVAGVVFS
jgi:hypothetical protein